MATTPSGQLILRVAEELAASEEEAIPWIQYAVVDGGRELLEDLKAWLPEALKNALNDDDRLPLCVALYLSEALSIPIPCTERGWEAFAKA